MGRLTGRVARVTGIRASDAQLFDKFPIDRGQLVGVKGVVNPAVQPTESTPTFSRAYPRDLREINPVTRPAACANTSISRGENNGSINHANAK